MDGFDIKKYTSSPLQIVASIQFKGKSTIEVFEILGNPILIPKWFLLAKAVNIHPSTKNGESAFNVEFTFFGDVYEEILDWNPPLRYVYLAHGKDFPIKDYVACLEIEETGIKEGVLHWKIYYSQIEGAHFQKIIPIILPPIIKESFELLTPLIGGIQSTTTAFSKKI